LSITIATILALAGALLFGISAVTERTGTKKVKREHGLSLKFLFDLVRQPVWLFGIGATVLGNVLHIFALDKGPLSLVEPLMVCALVFATLISAYQTKNWDLAVIAGATACFLGIAGFLAIGQPKGGKSSVSNDVVLPLALGLAISLGACVAVAKRSSALRPLALALASGISTGVGALLIKLVTGEVSHGWGHVFTNWPIYGLAVLGPLGFMLNQRAFQHSTRVSQVLSIVTTVNPVVAVALGVGLLDEKIRHSPLAITGEAVSLVLAIAGIVVIAYHSPQAKKKAEAENVRAGG
jgi:drug/metabolite transporter (DMT)-like permease